jgi:hypothetical protein
MEVVLSLLLLVSRSRDMELGCHLPGNFNNFVDIPAASSLASKRDACVDFPDLSSPSITMNGPLGGISVN